MVNGLDNFDEHAQQALAFAEQEARRFTHNYLGTEHLLLGLVRVEDGAAARVLRTLGVELDRIRDAVEAAIGPGVRLDGSEIQLTPGARAAAEFAHEESRRFRRERVGTEHLLVGLIREREGLAAVVLRRLGISLGAVLEVMLKAQGSLPVTRTEFISAAGERTIQLGARVAEVTFSMGPISSQKRLLNFIGKAYYMTDQARQVAADESGRWEFAATLEEIAAMLQAEIAQLQAEDQRG